MVTREESHPRKKPEWRQVIYLFFLISTNVGWRPDSEGLELTWDRVKIRKRTVTLPNGEKKMNGLLTYEYGIAKQT